MTEKRYYSVDYDEEYYIFDSKIIPKEKVDEESQYSYAVFADSLTSEEIVNKLNNQEEQLFCLKTELDKYKIISARKQMDYIDLKRVHIGLKEEIKELAGIRCELIRELDEKCKRIEELEKENEAQSNAINTLHDTLAHIDLEEMIE